MRENSPEEQYDYSKKIFDKKDYYKAKTQFSIVVLNNPGSQIIDKAQYHLAECHYYLKEYIQAIAEYEKLARSMPQSPFVDDARFKVGLCYYKLGPGYALDQEYTIKAIMQFQTFLDEFPYSEIRGEVEDMLSKARTKLAKKEYKTGELYRKMGHSESAIISFNEVIDKFYDTEYADDALFWKGDCYRRLMNWEASKEAFGTLLDKYPQSTYTESARNRLKKVTEKINQAPKEQTEAP